MAGVNKVTLIGNLGGDPEVRTFSSGDRVANFSLATSESWRDKQSGERRERTEWHRVAVFNEALVRVVESYLVKGSRVYVEGALRTRKRVDRDGVERYATEVVLPRFKGEITILSSPREGGSTLEAGAAERPSARETFPADLDEIPF